MKRMGRIYLARPLALTGPLLKEKALAVVPGGDADDRRWE
jgi:hypothetical protein